MNRIERAVIKQAKKIIFKYADNEFEKYKKMILEKKTRTHLDIFNVGLIIDADRAVLKVIETAQKKLSEKT